MLPLLLIVYTQGALYLWPTHPKANRQAEGGCLGLRACQREAWCSRDTASAHRTRDLGLCGRPARAHMGSPWSPSLWQDGSFDCQIQEGKAHNIHKCIVACVVFAQLQLRVTETWALGPIFAVCLWLRGAQISSAGNHPNSMNGAKGLGFW